MKLQFASILAIPALLLMGCMGTSDSAQVKAKDTKKAGDAHDHAHKDGKHADHHDHGDAAKVDTVKAERDKLSPEDRALVDAQEWCVISDGRLGGMGAPVKIMVKDQPVFICCDGCKDAALKDADKTIAKLDELKAKKKSGKPADDKAGHHDGPTAAEIQAARANLSPEDRALVDAQEWCPIMPDERLGSMGAPVKIMIKDQPVFLCCTGCKKDALADEAKTLAKVEELKAKKKAGGHDHAKAGDAHGHHHDATDADIKAAREKLSAEDRALADAQEWCPVMPDDRLGCSGAPIKLTLKGQTVFVCCKGCVEKAQAEPDKTLAKAEELKTKKKAAAGGK